MCVCVCRWLGQLSRDDNLSQGRAISLSTSVTVTYTVPAASRVRLNDHDPMMVVAMIDCLQYRNIWCISACGSATLGGYFQGICFGVLWCHFFFFVLIYEYLMTKNKEFNVKLVRKS